MISILKTGCEVLAAILEFYEGKKRAPRYNSRHTRIPHHSQHVNITGYAVFRGRNDSEDVIIRLENGKVNGFTYYAHESQVQPDELMIPLPDHAYTNALVQKAISRKYYKRLQLN
jgi:hypothetical protein